MASRYRSLSAYRLSARLADDVQREVRNWSELDQRTVGEQLIRAADSVGANIAEASGRWTAADKRNFLVIARGSLYETEHWLERATVRGLIHWGFDERLAEIARALNGMIKQPGPR